MACILVKPYFYVTNFCYAVEKKKKKKIPTLVHMNGIKEKRKKEKWLKSEIEEYQQSKMVERRNRRKTSELEKSIYHRCKQNNKIFG